MPIDSVKVSPDNCIEAALTDIANGVLEDEAYEYMGIPFYTASQVLPDLRGQFTDMESLTSYVAAMLLTATAEALNEYPSKLAASVLADTLSSLREDAEANNGHYSETYGMLYSYDGAIASVPTEGGWRIPTEEDWAALVQSFTSDAGGEDSGKEYSGVSSALMADALFCGEKIWEYSPDCEPGNESGFSALPGGYHSMGEFTGFNEYAVFWSADAYENGGLYHYIYYTDPDLKINYGTGDFRANVRCVRNSGE